MQLDLGDSVICAEAKKVETRFSIGGNPLIQRNDFDEVKLNELQPGETFTGKLQVSRILDKPEKTYNTAIIEVFNNEDCEKLTLFVNFDSRSETINVDDQFDFYIDFFNICKSLNVMNGAKSEDIHSINRVDTLKYLTALDSLDLVEVVVLEKENGYNTFILKEVV